jgi:hypothetical protein
MAALNAHAVAAGSQIRSATGKRAQYPFFAQDLSGVQIPTLTCLPRCDLAADLRELAEAANGGKGGPLCYSQVKTAYHHYG